MNVLSRFLARVMFGLSKCIEVISSMLILLYVALAGFVIAAMLCGLLPFAVLYALALKTSGDMSDMLEYADIVKEEDNE